MVIATASVKNTELVTVFRETADKLRQLGWTQYRAISPDGSVCLRTALYLACGVESRRLRREYPDCNLYDEAYEALETSLGRFMVEFNDEPARTEEEVFTALDKAIEAVMT